jgi:hypothetical protein
VTAEDRGGSFRVGDITAYGGPQIGVAGGVADDGGHGVPTAESLGGDGAARPAARAEDGNVGHVRQTRTAAVSYRNETGGTLRR